MFSSQFHLPLPAGDTSQVMEERASVTLPGRPADRVLLEALRSLGGSLASRMEADLVAGGIAAARPFAQATITVLGDRTEVRVDACCAY